MFSTCLLPNKWKKFQSHVLESLSSTKFTHYKPTPVAYYFMQPSIEFLFELSGENNFLKWRWLKFPKGIKLPYSNIPSLWIKRKKKFSRAVVCSEFLSTEIAAGRSVLFCCLFFKATYYHFSGSLSREITRNIQTQQRFQTRLVMSTHTFPKSCLYLWLFSRCINLDLYVSKQPKINILQILQFCPCITSLLHK